MKAIVYEKYALPDDFQLSEVDTPAPEDNEVMINVPAAGVTLSDCWMRSCTSLPGFNLLLRIASGRAPQHPILGTDLSGEIAALGKGVTRLNVGEAIYAFTGMKF
jgi:NADPH:quinone reductase-like Zn-dependent oxidoreductase